jgi:cobalt/nickel transport system permease protein
MTHMHIPDGILPVWLWALGFILMTLFLGFILHRLRTMDMKKMIPLLGALSAAMLVGMSIPILPGYHINLSVVTGILIGPSLGFVAAFIANMILAFMGHGGITVVGLNTLLLGSEAVLGHTLFYLFKKRLPVFWRAVLATLMTLFITTTILIGIVAMAHIDPEMLHHGEDHGHEPTGQGSISTFALLVLTIGAVGWIIEAAITGAVVRFISQVKPDLLWHVLHEKKTGE